jgi:serine/threonine protein phosphatase PrpC
MSSYEVNFSGTTCVIAIILKNKLIIANAGDSRAVLYFENNSNSVLIKKNL